MHAAEQGGIMLDVAAGPHDELVPLARRRGRAGLLDQVVSNAVAERTAEDVHVLPHGAEDGVVQVQPPSHKPIPKCPTGGRHSVQAQESLASLVRLSSIGTADKASRGHQTSG